VNLVQRLRSRRRVDRDLAEELAGHIDSRTAELVAAGAGRGEARQQACRELGNTTLLIERGRDVWRFTLVENAWQDLRYALRQFRAAPVFAIAVVLTLALGIGANVAIFGAVNGLLIRTLPAVADPGSLVRLRSTGQNQMATGMSEYGYSRNVGGREVRATFSYPTYLALQQASRATSDLFAGAPLGTLTLASENIVDVADTFASTGNFYPGLGIQAVLGRSLNAADDKPGAQPAAMISYSYWRARFGGRPDVVGKGIRLNDVPLTIVGLLPADFVGVQRSTGEAPDVSVPLSLVGLLFPERAAALREPTYWWLQILGRLHPGATAAQVSGNLAGVFQASARAGFGSYLAGLPEKDRSLARNRDRKAVPDLLVDSASRGVYDAQADVIGTVTMIGAAVGLILLLVCANVANLLLSRAAARQRELAVRRSLGAPRSRLVRQLLTESLVLSLAGGLAGVVLAWCGRPLLPGAVGDAFTFDWRLWAFAFVVATLTGLAFGVVPALRGSDAAGRQAGAGRRIVPSRSRLGRSLVVVQVAVSLVLLIGAGLFVQTVRNLTAVDPGFDPSSILLFRVTPTPAAYARTALPGLYDRIADRIAALPGVRSVGFSQNTLLSGFQSMTTVFSAGERHGSVYRLVVSPTFFDTLGIPLLTGRMLSARDDGAAPKVALINRAAARAFFQTDSPLGRRFGYSLEDDAASEIVGVVGDVKYSDLRADAPPTIYLPQAQNPQPRINFEVRTAGAPASVIAEVREVLRNIDPNLPMTSVTTQTDAIGGGIASERALASTYSFFGVLATFVAAVGLFGLVSYGIAQRTNEIGVRMALGARSGRVLRLVMGESMGMVVLGIAIGLVAAVAAGGLIAAQLYGVAPLDVTTTVGATLLLLAISSVAAYFPARQAARVDPSCALRSE
jgi:predicted permease